MCGRENVIGLIVISKQGHDAGDCYVVVSAAGNNDTKIRGPEYVMVANGVNRPLDKPKRKNAIHLSITKTQIPDFNNLLSGEPVSSNLKIARFLKEFNKENG